MKYVLILLGCLVLISCRKVEDHYRISEVEIVVGNVSLGPNECCVEIGDSTDSIFQDLIAVQIEFKREYYSTDSSNTTGIMYTPIGWEGCDEKITELNILAESMAINDLLFGDSLITGKEKGASTSGRCQLNFGCDCRPVMSINDISSLVEAFNNQQKNRDRRFISEKNDETPFLFFIKKADILELQGKQLTLEMKMSNGDILVGKSNVLNIN
ncbi:MAG: hypothetical protein MK105_16330 [Crocinitomicaceae bacterium]|nr:hypothetical protein [Crocinitomicaceae bacterium]